VEIFLILYINPVMKDEKAISPGSGALKAGRWKLEAGRNPATKKKKNPYSPSFPNEGAMVIAFVML
jgi:hypothetical protein